MLPEVALTKDALVTVLSAFGRSVTDEMLQRGQCSIGLVKMSGTQAIDLGRTHLTSQKRVLTHRLLHTRPAGIPRQVEDGTITDVGTLQSDFLTNDLTHLAGQFGLPCSGHTDARGEYGGTDSHVAVGCFLGKEQRNVEARALEVVALQGIAGLGGQLRIETVVERLLRPGVGAERGPQHANMRIHHFGHKAG